MNAKKAKKLRKMAREKGADLDERLLVAQIHNIRTGPITRQRVTALNAPNTTRGLYRNLKKVGHDAQAT